MSNRTHIIKLPKRTGKLEVVEESARIVFRLRFDKYGDFGDVVQVKKWLKPIFDKYESDKRPMVMDNPTTGEVITIVGDANGSIALVQRPPNPQ